jgi:autotransporter-associated beta strand protein
MAAACLAFTPGQMEAATLSLTGTSYTQNFDGIGAGLPTGWDVRTGATATALGTTASITATPGTTTAWGDTTGAFKNVASYDGMASNAFTATQTSATDRALGLRATGAFGDSGAAFNFNFDATSASFSGASTALSLSLQMLSVQARSQTFTVQYGIGAAPSTFTTLGTYTDPAVFGSTTLSYTGTDLSALTGQANAWIRVVGLTSSTGSGSRDTIGLDDFSLVYASVSSGTSLYWLGADTTRGGDGTWSAAGTTWSATDADGPAVAYDSTKAVVFSGTTAGAVTVSGTVAANAGITFSTTGYTLSGGTEITLTGATNTITTGASVDAVISTPLGGATGMIKGGAGKLILDGANGYTGNTTISAGTLQIGNGATTGSFSGTVANNGTLAFNRSNDYSFAGAISGSGALTQLGSGVLTLGTNSYLGLTTVSAGTIRATNATSLGTTAGGVSVTSGAALELIGGITIGAEALSLGGTGVNSGGALRNISGDNAYGGALTLTAATRINSDSGTLTLGSGTGVTGGNFALTFGGAGNTSVSSALGSSVASLTKDGTGVLGLSAAAAYAGGTAIKNGALQVTGGNDRLLASGLVTMGDTSTSGKLILGDATAASSQTLAGLTTTGAGGSVVGAHATNNSALTLAISSGTNSFGGSIGGAGTNENRISLSKTGAGILALSGASSFTGGTSISAGQVIVSNNSALGTGAVAMSGGSLIGASGITTSNAITVGTAASPPSTNPFTVTWNFGTTAGSASPSSSTAVGFTVGNVTQGNPFGTAAILSSTSASTTYSGVSGQFNAGIPANIGSLSTATSPYFEFSLTPSTASSVSLNDLSFGARSTGTGPQAYVVRSSADNYAADLTSGTIANDSTWNLKNAAFADTSFLTGTTFRLYGYSGAGNPSSGSINWRIDDLSLIGTSTITGAASGTGKIGIAETGTTTFTGGVTVNNTATFSSVLGGLARFMDVGISGLGSIDKIGEGEVEFTANNSYEGTTTISAGMLRLSGKGSLSKTTGVSISGGTLLVGSSESTPIPINKSALVSLGGTGTSVLQLGSGVTQVSTTPLTLLSGGTKVIDFGGTSSSLTFNTIKSTTTNTLQIWNWSGGGTFTASSGLDGVNLSDISFYSGKGTEPGSDFLGIASFQGGGLSGNLVPVPEVGAVFGALGLLAPLAWRERRHWMRCRAARA